jgi:hypothetical protein
MALDGPASFLIMRAVMALLVGSALVLAVLRVSHCGAGCLATSGSKDVVVDVPT